MSEDMLRDKRALRLRSEEKCSGQGGSARFELGNFCLFISISTGRLNTKWLLPMQTLW